MQCKWWLFFIIRVPCKVLTIFGILSRYCALQPGMKCFAVLQSLKTNKNFMPTTFRVQTIFNCETLLCCLFLSLTCWEISLAALHFFGSAPSLNGVAETENFHNRCEYIQRSCKASVSHRRTSYGTFCW